MKIIINENQYKLLLEATEGLDSFIDVLKQKMDLSDELAEEINVEPFTRAIKATQNIRKIAKNIAISKKFTRRY